MTDRTDHLTEYHLQEALRHLGEAGGGDLRRTNAVAIDEVADTVARVLREYEQDR